MASLISLRTSLTGIPFNSFYVKELAKLTFRAALHPRQTRSWFQLLNSHPLYGDLVEAQPRLIYKIYRPYLTATLDCAQRLRMLASHYRFILRKGWAPIMAQAARSPVELCSLRGKSGAVYAIQLRAVPTECEGEMMLQLTCGGEVVYLIIFSFFEVDGQLQAGVGCMKGPKGSGAMTLLREVACDLHGLRPKNLLVYLVRQIGHDAGCEDVLLVSNRNHPARYAIRKGQVYADYDTLWEELGATRRPDGDFVLPCANLAQPDIDKFTPKKRSEKRRAEASERHALLAAVLAAVRDRLDTTCRAPLPSTVMHAQREPAKASEQVAR